MVEPQPVHRITNSMRHRPWHLQNRTFVVNMIIVFITDHTINLRFAHSSKMPSFSTPRALHPTHFSSMILILFCILHDHISLCMLLLLRVEHVFRSGHLHTPLLLSSS